MRRLSAILALVLLSQFLQAGTLYDSGDPSPAEQAVLELINRARANPLAEGTRLGIDIKEGLSAQEASNVGVRPPLAMNKILLGAARAHSQDMWTRAFFAHTNPDGKSPDQRVTAAGYNWTSFGENIATGSNHSAADLEDILMIDAGVTGRGHRKNLLDIISSFKEIGVGFYSGSSANAMNYKNFLTQDFGGAGSGFFLVGVVYNDANGNGFYDIGEGLSGVTVTPDSGVFSALTGSAGAYTFPVGATGTLNVSLSGGGLAANTATVILSAKNAKLDFKSPAAAGSGVTAPVVPANLIAVGASTNQIDVTWTDASSNEDNFKLERSADGATGWAPIATPLANATAFSNTGLAPATTYYFRIRASNSAGDSANSNTASATTSSDTGGGTGGIGGTGGTGGTGGAGGTGTMITSATDTDGDLFPDELETYLGSTSSDAASSPNAPKAPFSAMPNLKVALNLNFSGKPEKDSLSLSWTHDVPAGFSVNGRQVTVDCGGVLRAFTLSIKGKGSSGRDTFQIRGKLKDGVTTARQALKLSLRISKATLAATWVDEALIDDTLISVTRTLPIYVLVSDSATGATFYENRSVVYNAKKGKTGKAK